MSLILASQSPRRRELLGYLTRDFVVEVADVDETVHPGTPSPEMVRQLALKKAVAVADHHPGDLVIGADTIVVIDGEVLGKPRDNADAANMLRCLSGREHTVYTGVALVQGEEQRAFVSATAVRFYKLDEDLINWYVSTGEPADKAGAYGIQGYGSVLVEGINGDYFTVMGLPVARLYRELEEMCQASGEQSKIFCE